MIGWSADFFRLAWSLLYWNARKSWFRLKGRGRRAPCQHPSDSGRALETQCEACLHWDRPARFARVCPLLVTTPVGLRCSAHAADVRPFWGRAGRYYGSVLAGIYLFGALGVFAFLRTIGYPISIVHVVWPGLWHRVPQARGAYFYEQGNRAMQAGRIKEALLNFDNAYRFDPSSYPAGLALARNYQSAQPTVSDSLYARLYREHVAQRAATAQDWFRALLVRGAYAPIADLAAKEILADASRANPWMRALLFAARQSGDPAPLRALLANPAPNAAIWHPLLERELLFQENPSAGRVALLRPWPLSAPAYAHYHQIEKLIAAGETFAALDQLGRLTGQLDNESVLSLRLAALAGAGHRAKVAYEFDVLLARPPSLPLMKVLGVHLIRYPDPELTRRVFERWERAPLPLDHEHVGAYFTLLSIAGVNGDRARVSSLVLQIKGMNSTPFLALNAVEAFFNRETATRRIATFLPILPVPVEVTYALLERYPEVPQRPSTVSSGL